MSGPALGVRSRFRYRAARADGTTERGVLDAESREAAAGALAARGLFPLELAARSALAAHRPAMRPDDLALGLRVLADLLESGLPVSRALAALEELAPEGWRVALPAVRERVRAGQSLGAALADAPVQVPALVVGMVRAGEAGSGLASAVRRAAEITEDAAATHAAIRGALAYPLILAAAGAASLGLITGVVLPRFAAILADLGGTLPPLTRAVLGAAALARAGWAGALGATALAVVAWRAWTATEDGRRRWAALMLATPLVGPVRMAAATARACAALSALQESGVPIAQALTHSARAAGDAALGARMLAAREDVLHGERLSRALATHGAATATAVRLARAGEESGRLAAMLAHAARIERDRATQHTRGMVRLLEPLLIIATGGLIALVAAALLQAIYSVRPVA